jgi:hypothetical protein
MITLQSPLQVTKSVSGFDILRIFDSPVEKTVDALVQFSDGTQKSLRVWNSDVYDSLGDWTEAQLETKLVLIISSAGFQLS